MAEMEDRWLSVGDICTYLGVSNDTVYRWIEKHAMPAIASPDHGNSGKSRSGVYCKRPITHSKPTSLTGRGFNSNIGRSGWHE